MQGKRKKIENTTAHTILLYLSEEIDAIGIDAFTSTTSHKNDLYDIANMHRR
jgi:hypothetical protein